MKWRRAGVELCEHCLDTARRSAWIDTAGRRAKERFDSLKEFEKVLAAIREEKALSDGSPSFVVHPSGLICTKLRNAIDARQLTG